MYKIEQRIKMEGYGTEDTYYDRVIDVKILKEDCSDEFEAAEWFIKKIHNMAVDFIVSLHNLKSGEEYVVKLDRTDYDDRLKTYIDDIKIGFVTEIVITKM